MNKTMYGWAVAAVVLLGLVAGATFSDAPITDRGVMARATEIVVPLADGPADDAWWSFGGPIWNNTSNTIQLGNGSPLSTHEVFLRFPMKLSADVTLLSAAIEFTACEQSDGGFCLVDISLIDRTDTPPFTEDQSSLPVVPDVGGGWVVPAWEADEAYVTPSLIELVRAYLDRPDYDPGASPYMGILLDGFPWPGHTPRSFYARDHSQGQRKAAVLRIVYRL